MAKNIFVSGATGQQGRAVVDALLESNSKKTGTWKILALTRDPNSSAAQKLAAKGGPNLELVKGDLNDHSFLVSYFTPDKNIYALFSVQNPYSAKGGVEEEKKQGIALADAAKRANVKHFIYSSVGGAEKDTGIPHFDSKWEIEKHIRSIGLPYTILRPVAFMDNFTAPGFLSTIFSSFYKYQMPKDRKLQLISVRDIGQFVRKALEDPSSYRGKEIEIAGDELTFDQANEIWKKHKGQNLPLTYSIITTFVKFLSKEMRTMFAFFADTGYQANIPELKRIYPDMWNFDTFMAHQM